MTDPISEIVKSVEKTKVTDDTDDEPLIEEASSSDDQDIACTSSMVTRMEMMVDPSTLTMGACASFIENLPRLESPNIVKAQVNFLKDMIQPCMPKSIPFISTTQTPRVNNGSLEFEEFDVFFRTSTESNGLLRDSDDLVKSDHITESPLGPTSDLTPRSFPPPAESLPFLFKSLKSPERGHILLLDNQFMRCILTIGPHIPRYDVVITMLTAISKSDRDLTEFEFNIVSETLPVKKQEPSSNILPPSADGFTPAINQINIFGGKDPDPRSCDVCLWRLHFTVENIRMREQGRFIL